MRVRTIGVAFTAVVSCIVVAGCAVQRAVVANETQQKMVGLTREQVLACMGPPANRMKEGSTEVWSYSSGNGLTTTVASAVTQTNTNVSGGSGVSTGSGLGTVTTSNRYCTVNVTMVGERVSRVNYVGPTGGLLTQGEQCAFAVQNCAQ
jgi:hypothetical protein